MISHVTDDIDYYCTERVLMISHVTDDIDY